jgi:hypothetical protein
MAAKLIPLKYHVNTNYTIYVPNDGKRRCGNTGIARSKAVQRARTRLVRK